MYILQVFYPGLATPQATDKVLTSDDVMKRISELLETHKRCERIAVLGGGFPLFAVDCKGDRIAD